MYRSAFVLLGLISGCGAPGVDTGADTAVGGPSLEDLPCADVVEVLDLSSGPARTASELTPDDPVRWMGEGEAPSELFAVSFEAATPVGLSLEYPVPELATSDSYWMRVVWLDDECSLHPVSRQMGGDGTHHTVDSEFTPTRSGWWFVMTSFPEAMSNPGAISYDLELARLE